MGAKSAAAAGSSDAFRKQVQERFGLVPNFFLSAAAAPGLVAELWRFAESAYIDNPLPSLFKERLFVHLSRFCRARYCIIRHVGFLVGQGRPAGDAQAAPHTVEQVIELLSRPAILPALEMAIVLSRLESMRPLDAIPAPGSRLEHDLFIAASALFLNPPNSARERQALSAALGERNLELLIAYLAFIRTAHYWTETHSEIVIEPDMEAFMREHHELADMMLSAGDTDERNDFGRHLHSELTALRHGQRGGQVALQQSEEQFRRLVQSVTDYAIYMLDPTGIVANWNIGARRIKGYEPQEIIGKHFSVFYSKEDREAGIPAQGLRTAAREGRWEKEGWRYRKDGSRFWANVVIDRITDDDGTIIGYAKITRDMTERREAQIALEQAREAMAQSQKMDAIGQLTGGVAHDFNNLLMAVLGSLELVGKRLPHQDGKLRLLLNNAFEGARRGVSLTQRMLSFARRRELALSAVSARELVIGMADLLDRSLGALITIETNIPADLPRIKADPNQLETAILNLVLNARDAMPRGGAIQIGGRSVERDGMMGGTASNESTEDWVVLSVRDSGEGMDETTLRRAVEPFYTTKGVGKGTGLGLSMVHGMTEQLGGHLRLTSKMGLGTTAELWLPVAEGLAPDERNFPTVAGAESGTRKLAIVLVDDDSLVLVNTSAMLEDAGHTVIEASSGRQALTLIRQAAQVDLVITDQAMPQMTGLQLAAAIKVEWPELPILLVSGYAELPSEDTLRVPKLAKPYSFDDLRHALETLMGGGRPPPEIFASTYRS
jgi:PAS domain S-box-containing protein